MNSEPSSDGLNRNNILNGCKMNDGIADIGDSAAMSHLSTADMSDMKGDSRGDLIPKKQVCYSFPF